MSKKWIKFVNNDFKDKNGNVFLKNTKYSIQSSDQTYYYFHREKVLKSLEGEMYEIGNVVD